MSRLTRGTGTATTFTATTTAGSTPKASSLSSTGECWTAGFCHLGCDGRLKLTVLVLAGAHAGLTSEKAER
jgi:hypothetical protein